ncbi:hypothetical protein ABZ835_19215 [Streptomyces sp. NPDC047461]
MDTALQKGAYAVQEQERAHFSAPPVSPHAQTNALNSSPASRRRAR